MVKQYLAVGVIDDAFLDDGRLNDVVHLLRHHDRLAEEFSYRLVEIANITCHVCGGNRLPSLLDEDDLPYSFQTPHLVDEQFHNDDGRDREKDGMILNRINFEDDKACIQEVELLVRVQQVVVFATFVVRLQHVEKIGQVKILFPDLFLTKQCRIVGGEVLVKAVERRNDTIVRLDTLDKERHGIGKGDLLRTGGRLVVFLPQREQQCLDALPLFHVEYLIRRVEGVEADGTLVRVGKVDPVLTLCLVAYHLTQALIAVSRVH